MITGSGGSGNSQTARINTLIYGRRDQPVFFRKYIYILLYGYALNIDLMAIFTICEICHKSRDYLMLQIRTPGEVSAQKSVDWFTKPGIRLCYKISV